MIDIRKHGGNFISGNNVFKKTLKRIPKRRATVLVLGTVNNSNAESGAANGVSTRVEENVTLRVSQPFSTSPTVYPVLTAIKYDDHIFKNVTKLERVVSEQGGNCSTSSSPFYAAPIGKNKDWYFIYSYTDWGSSYRRYSVGLWNIETSEWRNWDNTNDFFVASELSGYYYRYNSTTGYLTKYNVLTDSQIYSVFLGANITPLATNFHTFTENSEYLFVTKSGTNTWGGLTGLNETWDVYRINKSTGETTNFLPAITSCGPNFRFWATETELFVHPGNYNSSIVANDSAFFIYNSETAERKTTVAPRVTATPIMYYPEKDVVVLRHSSVGGTPRFSEVIFHAINVKDNTLENTPFYQVESAWAGSSPRGSIFRNEGAVVSREITKAVMTGEREYFSGIGNIMAPDFPYFIYDIIVQ